MTQVVRHNLFASASVPTKERAVFAFGLLMLTERYYHRKIFEQMVATPKKVLLVSDCMGEAASGDRWSRLFASLGFVQLPMLRETSLEESSTERQLCVLQNSFGVRIGPLVHQSSVMSSAFADEPLAQGAPLVLN